MTPNQKIIRFNKNVFVWPRCRLPLQYLKTRNVRLLLGQSSRFTSAETKPEVYLVTQVHFFSVEVLSFQKKGIFSLRKLTASDVFWRVMKIFPRWLKLPIYVGSCSTDRIDVTCIRRFYQSVMSDETPRSGVMRVSRCSFCSPISLYVVPCIYVTQCEFRCWKFDLIGTNAEKQDENFKQM